MNSAALQQQYMAAAARGPQIRATSQMVPQSQQAAVQRAQQHMQQQTQMMGTRTMGPQGQPRSCSACLDPFAERMMPATGPQRNGMGPPPAAYKGYNQQARGAPGTNQPYGGAGGIALEASTLSQASIQVG